MGIPNSYGGRKIEATGIAWYRAEDYEKCLALMDDRHVLCPTFKEWLPKALEAEKMIAKQGGKAVRAYIDPVEFPQWCAANGITKLDQHARTKWGNLQAFDSLSR